MARRMKNRAKGENTVIGAGTVIGGTIVSDATAIRVDGKVNGGIDTKGDLIIGPDAEVNGDISAFSLINSGTVIGNVNTTHRIEIEAGGKLIGDIETELIAIDETAIYQGRVVMRGVGTLAAQDSTDTADENAGKKEEE